MLWWEAVGSLQSHSGAAGLGGKDGEGGCWCEGVIWNLCSSPEVWEWGDTWVGKLPKTPVLLWGGGIGRDKEQVGRCWGGEATGPGGQGWVRVTPGWERAVLPNHTVPCRLCSPLRAVPGRISSYTVSWL